MNVLLDTDVLVECLRGIPAAQEWLEQNSEERFQIPGVVAMELVIGCKNREDLDRTNEFLERFDVAWPETLEFALAFELLSRYRLVSALGIPDCLIAATALSRSARSFTFNLKHFGIIEGLDVQEPYQRS